MSRRPVIYVLIQSHALANGGIASLSQVIEGLRRHRPIIVTDRETPRVEEWKGMGIETHVVPQTVSEGVARDPLGAVSSYWRFARTLRRLIKSSGAKVIHANDPAALQLSITPAKLTGAKLVFNLRDTFDPDRPPARLKYRLLFAAADHVLFLSHDMASRWNEHVPNAVTSYSVTYSAVDLSQFFPSSVAEDPEPIVLVSGLIRPRKHQLEFIRNVVPTLAKRGIKVWFASDFAPERDPYMAACADAAVEFGNSVRFLGYRTDISQLIAKSTVIAVPSLHEGLVRAMLEGMSCARPVVSFDICSAREILEEQSGGAGIVVPSGDYDALAAAILAYCRDPDLAASAGQRGRDTALRLFSADKVIPRYEDAYDSAALSAAATI